MTYKVPYGGPVLGEEEKKAIEDTYASGRFWDGEKTHQIEKDLAYKTGASDAVFTNSGSSALLLALEAAKEIGGLKRGDKVLTAALTFPTAVNIIIQQGYVPVFLDVDIPSLQLNAHEIEEAVKKYKPKAAIITHVIGNSPDMSTIKETLTDNKVIGIEDACDCLGGTWKGEAVGTILDFGCYSFHPAHPLTGGIGGAVVTRRMDSGDMHDQFQKMHRGDILRRYRDWGRVDQNFVPEERFFTYKGNRLDKRYTYSHRAYNLMCSELHAAIAVEQLKKLETFIRKRKDIFDAIQGTLEEYNFLIKPDVRIEADPVWFGYPVTQFGPYNYTKEGAMNYFENRGIETRSIYGGPVTIQPAYNDPKPKYKVAKGGLTNSMYLHNNSFWVSVWHGLESEQVQYLLDYLKIFMEAARDNRCR